ncbi:MAG: cytochrome c biogenesis protein CcsA [Bacteroidetes bacterium]|nr:cytochrome c biogenesis protein CcsA [Bacteroidota bacterium]
MKQHWYKILSVILIVYTLIYGFLVSVPRLDILNETIRNLFYHVPIWFAMIFMMSVSVYYAVVSLFKNSKDHFKLSYNAASVGLFFAVPGILTGSLWAKFTWQTWWTFQDPKLNGVAIGILIYLAYFILVSSIDNDDTKSRIASVYNIFAFVMLNVFIMILPRLTDSLHPGNGGNPAFSKYDLDSNMRLVFYPAVIGWVLFSCWILNIFNRTSNLKLNNDEN